MNKIDYILTYWLKVKLRRKDHEISDHLSDEIVEIYNEFEERKRLNRIKFSLLFENEYYERKTRK